MTNQSFSNLISKEQAASILGVSGLTVHRWTKSGTITAYRIGKKVRFSKEAIERLAQGTPQSNNHKETV